MTSPTSMLNKLIQQLMCASSSFKAIIGALALLSSFTISGCSPQATNNAVSAPSNESSTETSAKPKIALVMKSLANEFFATMAEGAKKHQSEHSDQYELIVNGIKDERDLSRQAALIEEMVSAGVKAIVVAPADSKALVPALRRAAKAGVIVINIDNKLDEEVLKQENIEIPFVGPNNELGAKLVGDHLATKLKAGDQVAVLEGIRTSFNGTQRRLGFEAAMKQAGMKIVDSQSAQWEMNQANSIASSMLSEHPNLKAILAANDSMAMGAMSAVKSANKSGEVLIVGFDNITAVQDAIKEGKILATADQHGDQLAVYGIEYALTLLNDPNTKVEDKETPVDLITIDQLK